MFGKKRISKGKNALALLSVLLLGVIVGALVFYLLVFNNPQQLQNRLQKLSLDQYLTELLDQERVTVDLGSSPVLGPQDAKVTLVEFSDFGCPYCRSFANDASKKLEAKYASRVKFVFKNLVVHEESITAHLAGYCAQQQGKFWEMAESLFAGDISSEESIVAQAEALELDQVKFKQCLKDPASTKAIEADKAYAQNVGISGTPSFFINGLRIVGALPIEVFEQVIDQELAK